ncbi:MAG: hypothetical protein ABSC01_01855, partial [Verrucomicrobiota bacterium]
GSAQVVSGTSRAVAAGRNVSSVLGQGRAIRKRELNHHDVNFSIGDDLLPRLDCQLQLTHSA